ncbi:unnamed protein product, partial [Natator depressus]
FMGAFAGEGEEEIYMLANCVCCIETDTWEEGLAIPIGIIGQILIDCTRYPQAKEQGPFFCTKAYKPVCGTNDMTYGNKCLLCSAIWETGINIGMKHKGKCGEKGESGTQLSVENEGECEPQWEVMGELVYSTRGTG